MSAFQNELLALTPALRAYAVAVTRQRPGSAEDLIQDTFEKAWRARDQFQAGSSMKAWLFAILRNSQHNEWRRSRRMVEDPDGAYAASLCSEPVQGWRTEVVDVLGAIDRLDPSVRQALLMAAAGLSYEEMAQVCDSPLRTVQSRVRRARRKISTELEILPEGSLSEAAA